MKTKQINKLHLNTALFKQIQDPTYQKNLHCYGNFYVAFLWKTRMEERKMECQLVALFFFKFCYVPRCTASNVPVKSKLQHPPWATPRAFEFLENLCSNSPLPGLKSCSNAPTRTCLRGRSGALFHWQRLVIAPKKYFYIVKTILIHRGYYMVARRYEFYVRVARTISHEWVQRTSEILFLPREHKIHIFELTCNVLFII